MVSTSQVFTKVFAGSFHSCGLTGAGAAYCWGHGANGRIGDGGSTSRNTPTAVSGGLSFSSLSAGNSTTCGLTGAGAVYCWGSGFYGQLGDGRTVDSSTPVAVAGGHTFASLANGTYSSSCGIKSTGETWCWGQDASNGLQPEPAKLLPGTLLP